MREVLRVVRRDTDFLRSAAAPLRKAAADIFWLRFLEDPERAPRRPPPASASRATAAPPLLPSSYPSGAHRAFFVISHDSARPTPPSVRPPVHPSIP